MPTPPPLNTFDDKAPPWDLSDLDANFAYLLGLIEAIVPPAVTVLTGDIIPSGAATRAGALLCDGSAVSRTTYSALWGVIGTTYGAGNGSTTFNVPDLRGRAPIGAGTGSGLTARARGDTGGEETHTLSAGESGTTAHTHTAAGAASGDLTYPSASGTDGSGVGTRPVVGQDNNGDKTIAVTLGSLSLSVNAATPASGSAHNNMQPFGVVNYFIIT